MSDGERAPQASIDTRMDGTIDTCIDSTIDGMIDHMLDGVVDGLIDPSFRNHVCDPSLVTSLSLSKVNRLKHTLCPGEFDHLVLMSSQTTTTTSTT